MPCPLSMCQGVIELGHMTNYFLGIWEFPILISRVATLIFFSIRILWIVFFFLHRPLPPHFQINIIPYSILNLNPAPTDKSNIIPHQRILLLQIMKTIIENHSGLSRFSGSQTQRTHLRPNSWIVYGTSKKKGEKDSENQNSRN